MRELRDLFRLVNVALAITAPVFIGGAVLLRNASEAVLQAFGLTIFLLTIAIFIGLDEKRRRRNHQ